MLRKFGVNLWAFWKIREKKSQWIKYGRAQKMLRVKCVLSKIELEFLKSPESFNANYAYGIKHRLNRKVKALSEEMELLQKSGFLNLTEINNNLTEFRKIPGTEQNSNQSAINPFLKLDGAFGGIWTRDHYLTKVTPHRTRLRRQILVLLSNNMRY